MRFKRHILVFIIPLALTVSTMAEGDDTAAMRKPPAGSVARQLRIQSLLRAQQEGSSLLASINHNRQEWDLLSPDQRENYRSKAYAFLKESPEKQEELLKHYDDLIRMSAQKRQQYQERAKWLKAVVERMTAEERKNLLDMTPEDQAKVLTDRRNELIKQGVLPAPTSSSSAPASASAKED
jgi:hypothetical protein